MKKFLNSNREYFLVTALLLLVSVVLFIKPASGSYTFAAADALSPGAVSQGIELAQEKDGEYPLWLPWIFSGLPSVHSFQNISHFYLPNYLLSLIMKLGLPAFWTTLFHLVLAGLGVYVLLRHQRLSVFSALFGGLAFMLTPYLITMIVHGHGSQMMTAAYIPWILWCLLRLKENPDWFRAGLMALFMGLQLQRAHVQIAYYTWLMVGLYLLFELFLMIKKKDWKTSGFFGYALIALLLSVGLAMIIYLPVSTYTPFSIRGGTGGGTGFEYATQWSFSFKEILTFFAPSFLGFGGATYWGNMPFTDYPNYMGILVLILAVYGAIVYKSNLRWVLITTALLALLLAFGKNFFLYKLFYNYFPYFSKFRVPVMFLVLTQFSAAVLAGFGLEALFRKIDEGRKDQKWVSYLLYGAVGLLVAVFLFGSAFAGLFHIPASQYPVINELRIKLLSTDMIVMAVFILLASGVLFALWKKWLNTSIALGIIILLSVIDLAVVDMKIIAPSKESYRSGTLQKSGNIKAYLRSDEVINFLSKDPDVFRILPLGQLMNENRWSAFHIESVMGYHPAKLNNYNQLITEVGVGTTGILRMLNVKYLLSVDPLEHPAFTEVFRGKLNFQGNYISCIVYQFEYFLPRVFYVDELHSRSDKAEQLALLAEPSFEPVYHSFIEVDEAAGTFPAAGQFSPRIVSRTANETRIQTKTTADQFMVISEIFYPEGWTASIDGTETSIYQVNSVLRGIPVPAGEHEIVMSFAPSDLKYGSILSWSSLVIILLLLSTGFIKRK